MLREYDDIILRLGEPLWWDGNGCPRYEPFHPDMCGVYDSHVALVKIGCQACDRTWIVANEYSPTDFANLCRNPVFPVPSSGDIGSFHYGDPPRHGGAEDCAAGDSMNSTPLEVLEFWSRDWIDGTEDPAKELDKEKPFGWTRKPQYEGIMKGDDDDDKVL